MTSTIQDLREYPLEPAYNYTSQVQGDPPEEEDIIEELSKSLSSHNISSYNTTCNPHNVVLSHKKTSHSRLKGLQQTGEDLKEELKGLTKKFEDWEEKKAREQEQIQQWEAFSRIAQIVNNTHLDKWNAEGDGQILVQALRKSNIHFLPVTLTAEAISWWQQTGELLVPALASYSEGQIKSYSNKAIRNQGLKSIIDAAWMQMWDSNDGVDVKLMLTTWAKSRFGHHRVRSVLSVEFAKDILADSDFDETRSRAYELIEEGVDWNGMSMFGV